MNYCPSQSVDNVTGCVMGYQTMLNSRCVYFISVVLNRKIEVC